MYGVFRYNISAGSPAKSTLSQGHGLSTGGGGEHIYMYIYIYIYIFGRVVIHPYISASYVLRPIQYCAEDVLTLVMPHTAKCGINPYISIHMTKIKYGTYTVQNI